jgi:hypothetical protein
MISVLFMILFSNTISCANDSSTITITSSQTNAPVPTPEPNPSITVKLNRIGVFDNGEDSLRDMDGGEIYLGVIITDGEKTTKSRLPTFEGQFFNLYDDDTIDVSDIIFSTSEVGNYLRIAVIGYESDGGQGETLVYEVLGKAAELYLTGGAASLLRKDIGTGNLIGQMFGSDDDWLGSFEKYWEKENNWGIGTYSDIGCYKEDDTIGLRLWFTIERDLN